MEDQIKGTFQDVAGKVQDAVGGATGDGELQAEGKVRQVAGIAQQKYGEALDSFREAAVANPATTLAIVAGVSFVLGAVWARRD